MHKIGFIGLGDMGIYMSRNMLKGGFSIKGFDISEARRDQFAKNGGVPCNSCAEVGIDIDVAVIMVVSGEQVESVMLGDNGIFETLKEGATVIVIATIGDKPMVEIARRAAIKGVEVIDCAVTGGQKGADMGTLAMMVSGKKPVYEASKPILEAMGKTIVYAGEKPGMGQVVKACNGVMSAITTIGICEALVLGVKAGVTPEVILEVVGNGTAGSYMFSHYTAKIMNREFENNGARLALLYKDINPVMELAREMGIPLHATAAANETIHAGMTRYPTQDIWAVMKLFEEMAGIEVKK